MAIRSHIQPQAYLKGFLSKKETEDENDTIFVYKKGMPYKTDSKNEPDNNPARLTTKSAAYIKNFYAFINDAGAKDPKTYETKLEQEIERPGNYVLEKLRDLDIKARESIPTREFLDKAEQMMFARYVCGMITKTELARKKHDDSVHKTVANTDQVGISFAEISKVVPQEEKDRFLAHLRGKNPDFDEETGRFSLPPKFKADFTYKGIKGELYPIGIFIHVESLSPKIMGMNWQFRVTPPEHTIPTSNEPVIYTNLKEPTAGLFFPISSNMIFCAYKEPADEIIYMDENPELATGLIKSYAPTCRELYFSKRNEEIVKLFNGE